MLHIAALIVSLFFSESYGKFNWSTIPKNIYDIQDHIKDESHVFPKTRAEYEELLAKTEAFTPDFDENIINLSTKRAENLKRIYEMKKNASNITLAVMENTKNILRQKAKKKTRKPINKVAVERALALMTQFVYAARYKLEYAQMLRREYKKYLEYKIGYCFALMREIRIQQMVIYTTMHYNYWRHVKEFHQYFYWWYFSWDFTKVKAWKAIDKPIAYSYADFETYFYGYEKIVKLDVNMLDVVSLVQELIKMRRTSTTGGPHQSTTTGSDSDYDIG